jgi:AcrR family transcriptional regulator
MKIKEPKRLAPEQRKSEILDAAKRLLSRDGLDKFSLEGVAREAGVAASLPRHYFGGHASLLVAAASAALIEAQHALTTPDLSISLPGRLSNFLDVVAAYPWAFDTYRRADDIHPALGSAARQARKKIAEISLLRTWDRMSLQEKIHTRGWIGYVEAVIGEWIERGMTDREVLLETMIEAARGMKIKGLW